jgi:hypothetical protein
MFDCNVNITEIVSVVVDVLTTVPHVSLDVALHVSCLQRRKFS